MAETKLTKKQQKAAQFKAGKKGKAAAIEDHPATPDDVVDPDDAPSTSAAVTTPKKKKVKASAPEVIEARTEESEPLSADGPVKKEEKRSAKRKRLAAEAEAAGKVGIAPEPTPSTSTKAVKEEAKPKKKSTKIAETSAPAKKTTFGDDGEVSSEQAVATPTAEPTASSAKGSKFILFVGNMAFTTTSDNIAKHFGQTCGEVPNVRLLTRKADPNALANLPASKRKSIAKGKAQDPTQPQSKGCAFVEFKSSEALRKALKFHHTMLEGRKINVELTAGGGGKSENRQKKIKEKNAGLEKERQKLHGKYVAPKNEARKQKAGEKVEGEGEGEARPAKRSRTEGGQEEGQGTWGRNSGRERKLPKFMATGANAVRVAPTS